MQTTLKRIGAAGASPVELETVKQHLRVSVAVDDALIGGYLAAATHYLDGWSGILGGHALMTQTWDLYLHGFPLGEIELPLFPVQSVTHIKYDDGDGAEQTLSVETYGVQLESDPALIVPKEPWPATQHKKIHSVRVRVVAGYPNANDVPAPIKQAILLMVGQWYDNREPLVMGMSTAVPAVTLDSLLAPYKRNWGVK